MKTIRDTYKYILKDGNRIVYVGTTNNPYRREGEHAKDKIFSKIEIVGNKTTNAAAKKWEKKRLDTYRKNHKGKNPNYNLNDNG